MVRPDRSPAHGFGAVSLERAALGRLGAGRQCQTQSHQIRGPPLRPPARPADPVEPSHPAPTRAT